MLDFSRPLRLESELGMQNRAANPASSGPIYTWSHRIVLAAVVGILFLTLIPFRFAFATSAPGNASRLFLGSSPKVASPLDVLLNILLFIPFGFGVASQLRERGKSRNATLVLTFLAGVLLSYTIEFLQIYIPTRDSGWEDIFTNSTGAVVGCILFDRWGGWALRSLSRSEEAIRAGLTLRRALFIVPSYFAVWFLVSVPLQMKTLLSNWDPECQLLVGDDASGRLDYAWKGRVWRLQLWDQVVPEALALKLTSENSMSPTATNLLADYEFSGPAPYIGQSEVLPALSWTPAPPKQQESDALTLGGKAWLTSKVPVREFVERVKRSNQFAIRVLVAPGEVSGEDRRIVSISKPGGISNLTLRADEANLVFWFRNSLSVKRSLLAWYTPNVFTAGQSRDILFSYDGTNLSLYIDGRKLPRTYKLGPGTGLAQRFRRVIPSELEGYNYIYYAFVFVPAGVLLGSLAGRIGTRWMEGALLLAASTVLPPVILELILKSVSGRAFSCVNLILSVLLTIGGGLWINADRRVQPGAVQPEIGA